MPVKHEVNSDINSCSCASNGPQTIGTKTDGSENHRMNRGCPEYRNLPLGRNTEKSPGDQRILTVTQPPV